MSDQVILLSLPQLVIALVPVVITLFILWRWAMAPGNALYALGRMLLQLLLIGYVLAWIFGATSGALVLLVLAVMLVASGWIALRTVPEHRISLLLASLAGAQSHADLSGYTDTLVGAVQKEVAFNHQQLLALTWTNGQNRARGPA